MGVVVVVVDKEFEDAALDDVIGSSFSVTREGEEVRA